MRPFKTAGRHIPRYRGKVGQTVHVPSEKNGDWRTCETLGEAALALTFEFDRDVLAYETQSRVDYRINNKKRMGFSDLRVWRRGHAPHHYEVRLDAALESSRAQEKLDAKREALEDVGEGMTVVPRSEALREPGYSNRKFLYRFRCYAVSAASLNYLLGLVGGESPKVLSIAEALDELRRASMPAATLYYAMATGLVQFDWDAPIKESAKVWGRKK